MSTLVRSVIIMICAPALVVAFGIFFIIATKNSDSFERNFGLIIGLTSALTGIILFFGYVRESIKDDAKLIREELVRIFIRGAIANDSVGSGRRKIKVHRAPGDRLLKFSEFFCSPKTLAQVIHPLVADWRLESFEAFHQGRTWKVRWISVRYNWQAIKTLGLVKAVAFVRLFTSAKV